jgi:hypothetical protein
MLLASLAADDDPPRRGGTVTWQQGTFDPEKYGIMTVNGKVVRSGPSATGDSFWIQDGSGGQEPERLVLTPAPQFKTVQDAMVSQYVPENNEKGVVETFTDTVKSVLSPMEAPVVNRTEYVTAPKTDYVTAAPSYFSLDSIFKSFGLDSSPKPVVASATMTTRPQVKPAQQKPVQQKKPASPSTPRPASPLALVQPRPSNINPLQMPQYRQPLRTKSPDTMLPVLVMGAAGVALLLFGIALINRKKA